MVVFLRSVDGRYDSLYLRNYAVIQIHDVLARLPGMGDVRVFGSGDYAMRLWLDPGKIAARNMDVDEVLAAVREQNVQVAAGQIGGQPSLPGTAVPIHRQCTGPAADRAGIRQHRGEERRQRRDDVSCATSRGSSSVPTTMRCAACWTAARRWRFRCSSCRARTRCSSRMRCARRMKELREELPRRRELRDRLRSDGIRAQFHRGGGAHLVRGGPAGGAGGRRIPADLARQRHSAGRGAGGHRRHAGGIAAARASRSIR